MTSSVAKWFAAAMTVLLTLVGCTSDTEPTLPSSRDTAAIVEQVTGPDGPAFLEDITATSWQDGGRDAGDLFRWIPRDATSTDRASAMRAGRTARAIAVFIADRCKKLAGDPANPTLWQAFADALAPYTGALVGDPTGVAGFEPVDGPGSQMRHTASLFAAMAKDAEANRIFTEAASQRAHTYEAAFGEAAVAEPLLADRGPAQNDLLRAARLRSLVATGTRLANPESERFTPARAQTEIAYQVASLTARPSDPHIEGRFFKDGRLLPPSDIGDSDWSIYDVQLTVYLTPWPRVIEAIREFGRAYDVIAQGQ